MSNAKRKWHCPYCSQDSSRHWNLKVHIKRRHNGIREPIDEEEINKIKNKMSNQFFYNNQSYSVNDLLVRSWKGKEKEQDIIDIMYQVVIERKEKLRKIKEIKSFFYELSTLSSSSQQPITVTGLGQMPITQPTIPPIATTAPTQPSPPQPAQSSQEQEEKKMIINPGTDFITNLFITSTLIVPELVRRLRGAGKGGEDSIITIQEPSLPPCMRTTTSHNNNDSKKRGELNPITENTKEQEHEEDRNDIEKHSLSEPNLLIDDQDDNDGGGVDHVYSDYDDGKKWVRKKIMHGDINDTY